MHSATCWRRVVQAAKKIHGRRGRVPKFRCGEPLHARGPSPALYEPSSIERSGALLLFIIMCGALEMHLVPLGEPLEKLGLQIALLFASGFIAFLQPQPPPRPKRTPPQSTSRPLSARRSPSKTVASPRSASASVRARPLPDNHLARLRFGRCLGTASTGASLPGSPRGVAACTTCAPARGELILSRSVAETLSTM